MDSITHTLFGVGLYHGIKKEDMSKKERYVLLFTCIGASQIPDIDVVSQLWDQNGQYQMWHRGITHSIFLAPVWALLFAGISRIVFGIRGNRPFLISLLAVFIHITSDLLNAWGTGYFEPFSSVRLTAGTVPIIDFVIWIIFALAFVVARLYPVYKRTRIFRIAWTLIALHVAVQSVQGYVLYEKYQDKYEQVALSARFLPWHFTVVGKGTHHVDLINDSLFSKAHLVERLDSSDSTDLAPLFAANPKAKTLYDWSPFVVVEDNSDRIGIYDPRFYRNGASFLAEYMEQKPGRDQP